MSEPPYADRVLVLQSGALGDCVLTLHWIQAMRRRCRGMRVTLAARSPIAVWAARRGLVSDATTLDAIDAHRLFDVTGEPPDELVCFIGGFDRVLSFLGGPNATPSQVLAAIVGGAVTAIDPRPGETLSREGPHIVDQWRRSALGDVPDEGVDRPLRIDCSAALRVEARDALRMRLRSTDTESRPIVLCHPGSGGLRKCCPLEAMDIVVTRLKASGCSVGWMIGPDEVERLGDDFRKRLERRAPVLFEPAVEKAADLLLGVDAYIGNDAGMTHVAALCGARTVALFGPSDPRVWRPLGVSCEILRFPDPTECLEAWAAKTAKHALDRNIGAAH